MKRLTAVALLATTLLATAACGSKSDDRVAAVSASSTTLPPTDATTTTTGRATSSSALGATSSTAVATTLAPTGSTIPALKLRLQQVASLKQPVGFATRAGDPSIFVAEKGGRVVRMERQGTQLVVVDTVINIVDRVADGYEQGLLGLAFSPDGTKLYLDYTNKSDDIRVSEFPYAKGRANSLAERVVLAIDHPGSTEHNGGQIVFGPDNFLYVTVGDGGSGSMPTKNAENLNSVLGKVLRIDPTPTDSAPYQVPRGNPFFAQGNKRGEIWHYGLRNPWRLSFDRATKEQWIADVGQAGFEEINRVPAGVAGRNFGWPRREGKHAYKNGAVQPGDTDPVAELAHTEGHCAIAGGYVYRGKAIPSLVGTYVFSDYCSGRILGTDGATMRDLSASTAKTATAFGEDQAGELYVLTLTGPIFRVTA